MSWKSPAITTCCRVAITATAQILKRHEADGDRRVKRSAQRKDEANKLAEKLQALTVTINAQADGDGKLFGSVTARQVAQELEAQGIKIPVQQILLEGALKEVGVHTVPLRLHADVQTSVRIWIVEK